MLQKLREKTSGWIATVILGLLMIPFAFFGMESYMSQQVETYVARIAQPPSWWASAPQVWPVTYFWTIHDIDAQTYRERVENMRMRMRETQGDAFDPKAFESVDNKRKILDDLIDEALMQLASERDGIIVDDSEVRKAILEVPGFQVDGKFNVDRYQLMLASQNPPMTARDFENKIRDSLRDELIPSRIARSAFATTGELDRLMRLLGEQRDVSFAMLPAPAMDAAPVTDAQIDAWYASHKASYRKPESVRLEYVEVDGSALPPADAGADEAALRKRYEEQIARYSSPEKRDIAHILIAVKADASAADKQAAEAKAKKLAADAKAAGADFAALAKANSDDTGSRDKGGELGLMSKGGMPGAFDDAAFSMQAGEVRGPVKTDFGWHIIKLNAVQAGQQRSFEEVRPELVQEMQAGGRERAFNERVGALVDAVYKNPNSLETAAKAMGLQVQTTPAFTRNGGEGIAADPKVLRVAFSDQMLQDETASDPIELGPERTVLIRVIDHAPERAQPLAEVREAVIAAIRADRQSKAAEAAADAVLASAKSKGLAEAAAAAGAAFGEANAVRRGSPVPSPEAVEAFFNQPRNKDGGVMLGKAKVEGQYIVFAIRAVHDGDISQVTPQERQQLMQQVAMANGLQAQDAFKRAARTKYQIKVAEDRL